MSAFRRREFLADVGRGMLVASVGSVLARDLGLVSAALGDEGVELWLRLTGRLRRPLKLAKLEELFPVLVGLFYLRDGHTWRCDRLIQSSLAALQREAIA